MTRRDPHHRGGLRRQMRGAPVALIVLLGCLVGLGAYLLGGGEEGSLRGTASACASGRGPEVARVRPSALGALRASVARVLPERIGRLYEEGPVFAGEAFSDNRPLAPALSPAALRPEAYEMRWSSARHDDLVADVFVFADGAAAQRFMERALSTRCRRAAAQVPSSRPAQAGNLTWVNPDGFVQADVYLTRGVRVYRVAEIPAQARGGSLGDTQKARAFYTIDALACLIPEAGCGLADRSAPV